MNTESGFFNLPTMSHIFFLKYFWAFTFFEISNRTYFGNALLIFKIGGVIQTNIYDKKIFQNYIAL